MSITAIFPKVELGGIKLFRSDSQDDVEILDNIVNCHPCLCLHVGLNQWEGDGGTRWTRNKRRRLYTMATLVEARMGRGEDPTNDMPMGTMGTSGLFVPTQEEERLYSNTTSFTNAEAKGKVNFV